jgi:hypothetical protein
LWHSSLHGQHEQRSSMSEFDLQGALKHAH